MPRELVDCSIVRDRIEAFREQALTAQEMSRVRAHLEVCPGCQAELSWAAAVQGAMRELPPYGLPEDVGRRVWRQIARDRVALHARMWRAPRGNWRWAAAAALLVAFLVASRAGIGPSNTSPRAAEIEEATVQARAALAAVGDMARRAGSRLSRETLGPRVAKRSADALQEVLAGPERQGGKP